MFLKAITCLNSPDGPIYYPHTKGDHDCQIDYEVELAIVIAETCKDVSEDEAVRYILGYMTANDVTSRRHQAETSQWDHGKGFDGFSPVGPTIVSSRSIPDPSVLKLRTVLNGKVVQDGMVQDMIFSVAKIVSFLSQVRLVIRTTPTLKYLMIQGLHPATGQCDTHWHTKWYWDKSDSRCFIIGARRVVCDNQPRPRDPNKQNLALSTRRSACGIAPLLKV